MKSFKLYQHRIILLPDNSIANGKYTIDGDFTIIIKDGFLNDGVSEDGTLLPAIQPIEHSAIRYFQKEFAVYETYS